MSLSSDQKEIWEKERQQQRRDKQSQAKEVKYRKVPLKFGGQNQKTTKNTTPNKPNLPSDDFLRKQLGL